jgi:hypothetical protein
MTKLGAAEVADSAAEIAAEQRRVRAEFVFMMGGELDAGGADLSMTDLDETAEAEGEADILAGREANAGRIALRRATRAMSLVARELDRSRVDTALTYARRAVKDLEAAFSRNRILLRALVEREDLDAARRLSGDLTELARAPRAAPAAVPSDVAAALRSVLAGAATGDARELSLLAERVLRAAPGDETLRKAAAAFGRASAAAARRDDAAVRRESRSATLLVAARLNELVARTAATPAASAAAAASIGYGDGLRGRRP